VKRKLLDNHYDRDTLCEYCKHRYIDLSVQLFFLLTRKNNISITTIIVGTASETSGHGIPYQSMFLSLWLRIGFTFCYEPVSQNSLAHLSIVRLERYNQPVHRVSNVGVHIEMRLQLSTVLILRELDNWGRCGVQDDLASCIVDIVVLNGVVVGVLGRLGAFSWCGFGWRLTFVDVVIVGIIFGRQNSQHFSLAVVADRVAVQR
jgi:hypothetical protein